MKARNADRLQWARVDEFEARHAELRLSIRQLAGIWSASVRWGNQMILFIDGAPDRAKAESMLLGRLVDLAEQFCSAKSMKRQLSALDWTQEEEWRADYNGLSIVRRMRAV